MANEVYASLSLTARKNGAEAIFSKSFNQDMSGDDLVQSTQLIGTSAETLDLGEITGAPSQLVIYNLDSTNFVEIGGDSGLTVFKLKLLAGKFALLPPSSGTLYAKADTASVRVQIIAVEL